MKLLQRKNLWDGFIRLLSISDLQLRRFSSSLLGRATSNKKERLVILGSGWGSYSVLRTVKRNKSLLKRLEVVVITPRNHFLFTPLLASTTVGTLEFRSIIEPVRNAGFRDEHDFHLSSAVGLDVQNKILHCRSALPPHVEYEVPYDKLVIGVGAVANDFGIPGVQEHAYFLREIADARAIRNKILTNFELATQLKTSDKERERLLHFVIVGGGPTGVEFGGEFYDFLMQDLNRLYPEEKGRAKVTLVEAQEILSAFNHKLQSYTEAIIASRKAMKIVKAAVTKVTSQKVTLSDGSELPCGMVIWSTGLAPRHFTKSVDLTKNEAGQIMVDSRLTAESDPHQSIYAIGDCAQIRENPLPCTAQVAERQGQYLAATALLHKPTDENPLPDEFAFKSFGMLAYVGGYKAVHDMPLDKSQGFHSWLLWRSAYMTKLGSWRLRLQVPVDWTKTQLFGRDTSRF